MENPELKQELTAIHEMYDEEMKKKKKELKLAQKENGTLIDDDEDELEAEKEDPVEPEDQSLKHIMVEGGDPSLPFKNPKDGFTEKGIQMKDRLAHFKKQAQRKVPWSVNLSTKSLLSFEFKQYVKHLLV